MMQTFYTTKMSAGHKELQLRFMRIRGKTRSMPKIGTACLTWLLMTVLICATVAMATVDGVEKGNLIINGKPHSVDIIHAETVLWPHTDGYYVPLRKIFELLGYQVTYDVDKSKYESRMDDTSFPAYDSGYYDYLMPFSDVAQWGVGTVYDQSIEEPTRVWIESPESYTKDIRNYLYRENPDRWKKAYATDAVKQYIYGATTGFNRQMPIVEMTKSGKTQYCQVGSLEYSVGTAAPPIIYEGNVYIPLRAVANILGGIENVQWNGKDTYYEGVLTFRKEDLTVSIDMTE